MEIAFRQINGATVLRNERLGVTVFATGIVELEARTGSKPYSGNSFVIERSGELIEAMEAVSAEGNQRVHSDMKDIGCLAQAWLQTSGVHSSGICKVAVPRKRKRWADRSARLIPCPAISPGMCA